MTLQKGDKHSSLEAPSLSVPAVELMPRCARPTFPSRTVCGSLSSDFFLNRRGKKTCVFSLLVSEEGGGS